jgi:hypothetical protein
LEIFYCPLSAKLLIRVVFNQLALDHRKQIAVIIINNESNRAMVPRPVSLELCEPTPMFFVVRVKHRPLSTIE